jgi:hypothetical protein
MKFMAATRPWKANWGLRFALAFPYGFHNEVVRKTAKEAGYEMQFTVYGRHMDINLAADQIGRYAIDSLKGDVFKAALDFGTTDSTQPGVETSQLASAAIARVFAMITASGCLLFLISSR